MFSVKTGRLNRSIQNEIKELNDNYWNSSHDLQTKADFVNKVSRSAFLIRHYPVSLSLFVALQLLRFL